MFGYIKTIIYLWWGLDNSCFPRDFGEAALDFFSSLASRGTVQVNCTVHSKK